MGSLEETTVNGLPSPLDPEEFRRQAHIVVDFIADYYRNVHNYPVRSQVSPGYLRGRLAESCPKLAEPLESILRDVRDHIMPGLTHWQSPNFFAYFPCCTSTAGFLGEMLSVGFNVVGFNWAASPAATELETIVMDWLGQMQALPSSFLFSGGGGGGVLQATTTEAVLSTLAAARDKKLREISGHRVNDLVVYCSEHTHCVLMKAAQVAGIQPENIRLLRTSRLDAFALSPDALRAKVEADVATGRVPLYLCATVGTTSTAAVDPLRGLCAVAKAHGMWVHVDAAYAGGACISPEFRHMIDGVEDVDSFSLNAHKLLFTTLGCCCLWVKEPKQLVDALSSNAEFLRNEGTDSKKVIDYMDWQIAFTHRFRALKLWMVLRSFGTANLRAFVRRAVSFAELFEGLVVEDEKFELVVPRNFSLVCFRLSPPITVNGGQLDAANEINRRLLEAVNATGKVFMTHSMVEGVYFIRFAAGASLTEKQYVLLAWAVVQEQAETVLAAAALEYAHGLPNKLSWNKTRKKFAFDCLLICK